MNCSYVYNNKNYTRDQIVGKYLKANRVLDSKAAIFSSDEVQQSAITEVKKLHNPSLAKSEEYTSIRDLITVENTKLFSGLELDDVTRLVPEYIEENRIKEYIKKNLSSVDVSQIPLNPEYSIDLYEKVILDSGVAKADPNVVKFLLSEIEQDIEDDKKTSKVSFMIHQIISTTIREKYPLTFNEAFDKFFDPTLEDLYGAVSDSNTEAWKHSISKIVFSIDEKIRNIGVPISNLHLVSAENSKLKVGGQIDLVAVDTDGVAHIFDIVASKKDFGNWDSAKRLTVDWELAIKRQLIGQALNVTSSRLYVIPIQIQALKSPNQVTLDKFKTRTGDPGSGLGTKGRLTSIAEKLLPRQIIVSHNPQRTKDLKNILTTILTEDYEIKTEIEDNNVDAIMKSAERRFERNKIWSKYNKFEDIQDLPEGWIEVKPADLTAEEVEKSKQLFRKQIEKYVDFVKEQENRGVSIMQDAIISALKTNQSIETSKFSSKKDQVVNHLITEYLNDNWEVVNFPEATALGIIVFRNKETNIINLFNLSAKNYYAKSAVPGYLAGDLDVVKAVAFLNEFKADLLPNSSFKLGQIITFNPVSADSYYKSPQEGLKMYQSLMNNNSLGAEVKLNVHDLLGVEDVAIANVVSAMRLYEGKHKDTIERIYNILGDGHIEAIEKMKLIEARNALIDAFPTHMNKTIQPELNFDDPIEVILALLQVAILSKEGVDPTGDFQHLTKYSFQEADFMSLIKTVYTKNVEEYDKTGKKIQWLIGGLAWTNPEYVQSKDLRQINGLMSTGNAFIGERMVKMNQITRKHTQKFYKALEYNTFERMTFGQSQSKHKNIYRLDGNGDVSKEFETKNPYLQDEHNALEDYEREYLMNLLLIINQYKYGIADQEIEAMDVTDIESLRTNQDLMNALDSGDYFKMPLIRREELSRYKDAFKSMSDEWKGLGMIKDSLNDLLDGRELSEDDVKNIDQQRLGFFEMYDVYGTQTNEIRAKMIEDRGTNYFELNLDTIAHRIAFNKIRKQTFDLILPTINSYMWWIKLIGAKQNVDVSKQLEYVVNQIKLAIFDEPLINDEQKTIAKGLSVARQISTVAMLAFRPALLAKEMTIGVLKNFSASALGINEAFGAKEMTLAYTKLMTIDNKFTDEFNMIDRINQFYRMANMDISTVAKKMQTDRWGAAKGIGRYMFMTSTVGDYYNRMSVLMAKMIKDGSYDAHSMVDGDLVYDPKKDARYSRYLAERENHKDSNGKYIPMAGNSESAIEYNKQRNMYLLAIDQLNKEGAVVNQKVLTEEDLLSKAYTQQERNSIKSYSDLMFGAYDKDWQAQFNNTIYGIAFMQFLTFWPNKMRQWFGKPIEGKDSTQGNVKQVTEKVDGVDTLQWWKTTENPDGSFSREAVSENTGDPVMAFEGTPQEGLFVSVMYTAQDIVKGNWKDVKDNKLRRDRAMFAVADAFLIAMMLWIMKAIFENITEEQGRGSVSGELLSFMDTVNTKVLYEYDVYGNTFGAINSEPLFFTWGSRTLNGINDAIMNDGDLKKLATRSIGAFEFLK